MSIGNPEIIQIADAVAREKSIPKELVIDAMEQAIQVAGRRKYGYKHNIKAKIDRKNGEIKLYRLFTVMPTDDEVENNAIEISLVDARYTNPEIEVGGVLEEELPPIDLGRVAAQAAKQVIVQKVRDVERERQYEDFKNRVGEIFNGVVKRIEYGNVVVDLGRDEAIITKEKIIPGEIFRQNDRVRVLIEAVKKSAKGQQVFLSRTSEQFIAKLFEQEVPEVYDNIIEIKSVSREPGSRAKMAVYSSDSSVDPVGACVGIRGARVQAIINELQGEKIDIVKWSSDPGIMVVNALAPAEVTKVVIDEDENRIEVVVPAEQLSIAIGKKGQNVRLAGRLMGWKIDVLTEEEESKRRSEEFVNSSQLFMEVLDVEEVIGQLLASEGYTKVEEIAYVPKSELINIEGFEEELVEELRSRAISYLEKQNIGVRKKILDLGVDPELVKLLGVLPLKKILRLAEAGIKNFEDLAELTISDFKEILPDHGIKNEEIDSFIKKAKLQEND